MSSVETLNLGIDVGKGFVKVCDGDKTYRYPSYYSLTDGYSVSQDQTMVNSISIGGYTYLCVNTYGPPVGEIIQPRDSSKTGKSTLLHACNVIAQAYESSHGRNGGSPVRVDARLCMGLPIGGYDFEKERLKKEIGGQHRFAWNGRDFTVNIDPHTCREGLGAYLAMVLSERGSIADKEMYDSLVAVADIGHRTTDVFLVKAGRADVRGCKSFQTGVFEIQSKVENWVSRFVGQLVETDEIRLFDWLAGGPLPKIKRRALNSADMNMARDEFLGEFYTLITERVTRFVDSLGVDELVFAGGGAELLRPFIERSEVAARICANPQFGNAIGFYKSLLLLGK